MRKTKLLLIGRRLKTLGSNANIAVAALSNTASSLEKSLRFLYVERDRIDIGWERG